VLPSRRSEPEGSSMIRRAFYPTVNVRACVPRGRLPPVMKAVVSGV
jgi:hypothetical protein